jgi:hypothetical protein
VSNDENLFGAGYLAYKQGGLSNACFEYPSRSKQQLTWLAGYLHAWYDRWEEHGSENAGKHTLRACQLVRIVGNELTIALRYPDAPPGTSELLQRVAQLCGRLGDIERSSGTAQSFTSARVDVSDRQIESPAP